MYLLIWFNCDNFVLLFSALCGILFKKVILEIYYMQFEFNIQKIKKVIGYINLLIALILKWYLMYIVWSFVLFTITSSKLQQI
jgi:hypothetical protein